MSDIIWNRVPFETRPLLRLADGSLCVLSPRALMSWLTDGFYYRALDAARAAGKRQAFTNFFGVLIENYVCDLFAQVLTGPRPVGGGRRPPRTGVRRRQAHSRSCHPTMAKTSFWSRSCPAD